MNEVFEKIIEKLEELNIENQSCSKCAYREECDAMQEKNDIADNACLCTMLMKLKAIEIVKQEAAEHNNGWIPVSERLPEERINPVTHDYYQYPVMLSSDGVEDIKYYYFGNGHWRYGLQIMDNYVTHWMDIKPYQPKGE